jgi:hypothetical protein
VVGVVNDRTLRLPRPVALLLASLAISASIIGTAAIFGYTEMREHLRVRIIHAHLPQILLDGFLALLVFAGSLHVDARDLRRRAWPDARVADPVLDEADEPVPGLPRRRTRAVSASRMWFTFLLSTWERIGKVADDLAPTTAHPSPLAEYPLCRQTPEVGAGCGKPARPDLCGGVRRQTSLPRTLNRRFAAHVKTLAAQEQRMLLTSRKLLQRKLLDLECDLRGTLRNFGLKVGVVSGSRYEARVRELVLGFPRLAAIAEPLLKVRRVMRQQLAVLHKMLLDTVRDDPVCRRLMTAPGVGEAAS